MHEKSCPTRNVVSNATCTISVCTHGTVHLALGPVTVRIAASSLEPLLDSLAYAAAVAQLPQARARASSFE